MSEYKYRLLLNPAKIFGLEPVAIINCFGISMSFSSPFAYSTETVPGRGEKMEGPSIRPYPLNTSIFPFFIKWATPPASRSTIPCFRFCTLSKRRRHLPFQCRMPPLPLRFGTLPRFLTAPYSGYILYAGMFRRAFLFLQRPF